ncbi:MAG: hypothetical protein ACQEWM_04060 [Actinomycetota bacterium]
MAGPLRVERDVEVARWVQEALDERATVGAVVPPIFDAYARILHPATREVPIGEVDAWGSPRFASHEITWAEAAELLGDRAAPGQPYTAWLARFGEQQAAMPDGGWIDEPHTGDIPLPLLTAIAELLVDEHGDAEVLAAVWEGSGLDPGGSGAIFFSWDDDELTPSQRKLREAALQSEEHAAHVASVDPEILAAMERQDVLGLPAEQQGRGHVLLRGRLGTFTDPTWAEHAGLGWRSEWPGSGRTPNLLWPADPHGAPAWMVATDLDLDLTLVGGSGHLIGRVLAHPSFEAERVRPADPLV